MYLTQTNQVHPLKFIQPLSTIELNSEKKKTGDQFQLLYFVSYKRFIPDLLYHP